MRTPSELRRDLPADLEDAEREALVVLALRLEAERPPPGASFRGDLRRKLTGTTKESRRLAVATSPRTTRVLVASYISSGLLLLVIAAVGLMEIGPFAPT
jgi:hypothetical protein